MNERADRESDAEILCVAPNLSLRIVSGRVEISVEDRRHYASRHALRVLEQFVRPSPVGDAIARLRASSAAEFVELTSLVLRLREEGMLVGAAQTLPRGEFGFDAPCEHVAMLDDETRTGLLRRAIHEVVRSCDVVLDIGTGTGVLAIEAARAGASRVYAIEEGELAVAAERVFDANGLSDRIRVVRGRSSSVDLPEKGDVLVSEIIGNDPLAEGIVPTFRDARRRLLKPGARLVPGSLELFALPVDLPNWFLARSTFTEDNVARWRGTLGIDFDALLAFAGRVVHLPKVTPREARSWTTAANPVSLARIDLSSANSVSPRRASFVAQRAVNHLGLVLYFEASLSPALILSTAPAAAPDDSSWRCSVYRALRGPVVAGESVQIEFSGSTGRTDLLAI